MKPYVSICVPIYNVEKYIERCARSLFEQTYENIEYIFVNDCTQDDSIQILNRIINEYPQRKGHLHIIHHKSNEGLASARNTAVEYCQTEFIMHVDSDDWIDLNVVEACVNNQLVTNADIVSIGVKRVHDGKEKADIIEWEDNVKEMTKRIIIHSVHNGVWGRLIKTSLYKQNNIKIEIGRGQSEDLQVVPRLFYYSNKTTFVDDAYYYYNNDNVTSYTASFSVENVSDSIKTFDFLINFFNTKDVSIAKAVRIRKVSELAKSIIRCAKVCAPAKELKWLKKQQDKDVEDYEQHLSWPERIVFHISNRYAMILYVSFAAKIKAGIKIVKEKKDEYILYHK